MSRGSQTVPNIKRHKVKQITDQCVRPRVDANCGNCFQCYSKLFAIQFSIHIGGVQIKVLL